VIWIYGTGDRTVDSRTLDELTRPLIMDNINPVDEFIHDPTLVSCSCGFLEKDVAPILLLTLDRP
jgi:hypothetical protein